MHTFFINDLIQLYCLWHVSNNQVFIFRKNCTCSFMVLYKCMIEYHKATCTRQYNWIKSLMKKVCISLVLLIYVYHNAWFKQCKAWKYLFNTVYLTVLQIQLIHTIKKLNYWMVVHPHCIIKWRQMLHSVNTTLYSIRTELQVWPKMINHH